MPPSKYGQQSPHCSPRVNGNLMKAVDGQSNENTDVKCYQGFRAFTTIYIFFTFFLMVQCKMTTTPPCIHIPPSPRLGTTCALTSKSSNVASRRTLEDRAPPVGCFWSHSRAANSVHALYLHMPKVAVPKAMRTPERQFHDPRELVHEGIALAQV